MIRVLRIQIWRRGCASCRGGAKRLICQRGGSEGGRWVLDFVYDLYVGGHVVLARELLEAERARIHLNVALVRGHVMPAEVADVRVDTRADLAAVRVLPLFGTIVAHRSLRLALTYVAAEIEFGLDGGRAADAATTAAQIGRTASKQLRLELEAIAAIVHIQIILSRVGSTHISVLLGLGAFLCARLGR